MVNGKWRVIDAHCHIYPEKIAAKAVGGTDRFYGVTSEHDGLVSSLLSCGERAGIDRFLVHSVATTPRQVRSINDFIAAEVAAHPERLFGFGTLHPESEDLAGDVAHLRERGLRGVKLHPDIQAFKLDDYRCLKIYELCEQYGLPLLIHTGDDRYDYSNPNRLLPILRIYTGITVIGAHFGGYSIWEEAAEQLAGTPNLYVDCSSSFHWIGADTAQRLIRTYGADRVLFGSDFPMWDPKKELDFLLSLGLTDDEYRMILAENAEKVCGL